MMLLNCRGTQRTAPFQLPPGPRLATLAENWNQYAKSYQANFSLTGERGELDENIVTSLNNWLNAFVENHDPDYASQLSKLKQVAGTTVFHEWEEYRMAHYRKGHLRLTLKMGAKQIAEEINNYIGVSNPANPMDYISPETVQTIVYMNSLCAYFNGNRDSLHAKGIDDRIGDCRELNTNGSFPALDAQIR